MPEKISPPPANGRFLTPYLVAWALLASLALGYLALLATRPELVSLFLPEPPNSARPDANEVKHATAVTRAELRALRDNVARVELDVAGLKSDVSGQADQQKDLALRLMALEQGPPGAPVLVEPPGVPEFGPARPVAETASEAPRGKAASRGGDKAGTQKAAAQKSDTPAPSASPAAKSADTKVINKPATASSPSTPPPPPALETGTVAPEKPAPLAFGPAVVKPASKPVGLLLATGPSVDALRLSWHLISDRQGGTLKNVEPRYRTSLDDTGLTYDLVVGPITSAPEAQRLCKALTQKAIPCKVSEFVGDAL